MAEKLFIPFRVLVIEFDDHTRTEMVRELSNKGFDVVGEKHGHLASRAAEETDPELFLISLDMPRLSGTFLIRKLRKEDQYKTAPIIALAASLEKNALSALRDMAVKDILMMPLDAKKLVSLVEKHYKIKVITEITKDM